MKRIVSAYEPGRITYLDRDGLPCEKRKGEFMFFAAEAKRADLRLAEFAAGAGRVSVPMVEYGAEVWAIEASEYMLERARILADKLLNEREKERLNFVLQDMRRVKLDVRVPLVIIPFESFWYNFKQAYFRRREDKIGPFYSTSPRFFRYIFLQAEWCLRSIINLLEEKGRFIIDSPGYGKKILKNEETDMIVQWWQAMAVAYNFTYALSFPYRCECAGGLYCNCRSLGRDSCMCCVPVLVGDKL